MTDETENADGDPRSDKEIYDEVFVVCPMCSGSGEGGADGTQCFRCHGHGDLPRNESQEEPDDEGDWWEKDDDF